MQRPGRRRLSPKTYVGVVLTIQRAADGEAAAVEDVGVDHGCGDIFVAQQFLKGANIITRFKQVDAIGKR